MAKKKYTLSKRILTNLYYKQKLSTFQIADKFSCTAGTIINYMKEYNIKRRHSGPRRVNISKKTLYSLYIQRGFSSKQIAKMCHCDQTAILNRLRKYNISIRHPKQKIIISKEDLKKLYRKQKLSTYKIAKIYDCGPKTVYRYLKLYRIETRPRKIINIPKNKLKTLYIKKKYPLSRIAKIYKCCSVAILDKMEKYKIPRRSTSEAGTIYPRNNFSGDFATKSYMIGFRVGDLRVRTNQFSIGIGCGTTKSAQVQLIKEVFRKYGPIWVSKKDKRGANHVECSLNSSFKFLLPKHKSIPKWIFKNKTNFFNFLAGYTDAEGNISIAGGRAKFRIRSYDKGILRNIHNRLRGLSINSLFGLDKRAGKDKRGVFRRKDYWGIIVNERKSLLKLFNFLKPLLKHRKRKNDLLKARKNVILRLKN
ncbi:MAG: hypothetical protein COT59_01990 [Candidatus Nealsonbacteria bacterium CG09_land_8_20_14_0_10_42_14]|uniref:DOD-type homing endonuclease domain-containing protein n=1 Tax=Candidatus Nealsonbacteria bacterium CG09_land_8_20_14_0_10_42_14 TaxID=1974707 RepID=A0A2H0WWZ8_9BACT|nr:MAG: hypothetical protein COT59_01990 [Candidatus Nealsonbacteria bacterium CG09_land_8_20_14_0_10_42_14]